MIAVYRSQDFRRFLVGAFMVSAGVQFYPSWMGVSIPLAGTKVIQTPELSSLCVAPVVAAVGGEAARHAADGVKNTASTETQNPRAGANGRKACEGEASDLTNVGRSHRLSAPNYWPGRVGTRVA